MRILVISDSHGYTYRLNEILRREHAAADIIVHCGDGAEEMLSMGEYTLGKTVFLCRGNCDSTVYGFEELNSFKADTKNVMACHGHRYGVKYGLTDIYFKAKETGSDICLFGHTHEPGYDYFNDIWFINPGSAADGSYAVVEITGNKINPVMKRL